jgi:hypothetical protein
MTETKANVAIVVDPDFGDRLVPLAKEMPVWIADNQTTDLSSNRCGLTTQMSRRFRLPAPTLRNGVETLLGRSTFITGNIRSRRPMTRLKSLA